MFPDYENSIVNLMSSILNSFDCKMQLPELKSLPSKNLIPRKNIILFVIDGLGYHFLNKEFESSLLQLNVRDKITSVFPATTAAAITTFLTGVPPASHGITGWNMWLKELGVVSTILPFTARMGVSLNSPYDLSRKIFNVESIFDKIKSQSYYILPKKLSNSAYSLAYSGNSKKIAINQIDDLFRAIGKSVNENARKKFIYAYWHQYDHAAHADGYNSKSAKSYIEQILVHLNGLNKFLEGTSSTLIITADHGFINTEKEKIIEMKDHPELSDCLTLPLCGESRAAYCYVKANKQQKFLKYVETHLSDKFDCVSSEELLQKGVFGFAPHHQLVHDRIGDYVLLAKDNYVIKDVIVNEEMFYYLGRHGGCSENEMYVPLIVLDYPSKEV